MRGVDANVATKSLKPGNSVKVGPSGLVIVKIDGLTTIERGTTVADKQLEIILGVFNADQSFSGFQLGFITTDASGNYKGPVVLDDGSPFVLDPAAAQGQRSVINDPGVRSEFVTSQPRER